MPFTISDAISSPHCQFSRVALALGHAAIDAETEPSIIAYRAKLQSQLVMVDYVAELLKECAKAWDEYIGHAFPKQLANDTANLNGFRHYMVQDALYLEHFYRLKTEAVAKTGTFDDIKKVAAKLASSLDWVSSFRDELTTKLGVPKNDVATEKPSKALLDSIALHDEVNKKGDWLDVNVVLLPCILGYYTIASRLYFNPETIRNSIYYPMWILANKSGSSAKDYTKFINDSIGSLSEDERKRRWPIWVDYFTRACNTEKAFFDLADPKVTQIPVYNVVPNRNYKIRSYRTGYSLVGRPDYSVTTSVKPTEGAWELTNSLDGYTFRSIAGQNGFLTTTLDDLTLPVYEIKLMPNDTAHQRWSINPITVENEQGKYQAFQIFVPGRTEFVLDADRSVNRPKVFAINNSQISNQIWLIEPLGA